MSGITSKRLYPSIVMKAALNIVSNINDDAENILGIQKAALNIVSNINDDAENILGIQKEINSLNNSIEEN
jgi:hypothetical protein